MTMTLHYATATIYSIKRFFTLAYRKYPDITYLTMLTVYKADANKL
jgi:hypothetical protein